MNFLVKTWSLSIVLTVVTACGSSPTAGGDGGPEGDGGGQADAAVDGSASLDGGGSDGALDGDSPRTDAGPLPRVNDLDLLFMIDNSNSMIEEQASLAAELPRLMRAIASGELRDSAGTLLRTFDPPTSIHVGVVSSDMGTGGFLIPTCAESDVGDDGVLRTQGNGSASCAPTYPRYLDFEASSGDDPVMFAHDVDCVANMGTGGCGFGQQLEAVLKALTPSSSGTTFVSGSQGQGDRANAGFLREGSVLAVIALTDADDCSVADTDLFRTDSSRYPGSLGLRCFQYPGAQHPTRRYVEGLLSLRSDSRRIVYAPIVGVPTDLVPGQRTNFVRVLADPRMEARIDPSNPDALVPSCDPPGRALPPRRIVEVGQAMEAAGAQVTVQSICQSNFTKPINSIISAIADALGG